MGRTDPGRGAAQVERGSRRLEWPDGGDVSPPAGGEEHLWRFLAGDGVEPTNNTTERGLRHGVLWRKSSGGTASVCGSRFVTRLLGVVATCRQQGRSVLNFLTDCFEASVRSQPLPSLRPRHALTNS